MRLVLLGHIRGGRARLIGAVDGARQGDCAGGARQIERQGSHDDRAINGARQGDCGLEIADGARQSHGGRRTIHGTRQGNSGLLVARNVGGEGHGGLFLAGNVSGQRDGGLEIANVGRQGDGGLEIADGARQGDSGLLVANISGESHGSLGAEIDGARQGLDVGGGGGVRHHCDDGGGDQRGRDSSSDETADGVLVHNLMVHLGCAKAEIRSAPASQKVAKSVRKRFQPFRNSIFQQVRRENERPEKVKRHCRNYRSDQAKPYLGPRPRVISALIIAVLPLATPGLGPLKRHSKTFWGRFHCVWMAERAKMSRLRRNGALALAASLTLLAGACSNDGGGGTTNPLTPNGGGSNQTDNGGGGVDAGPIAGTNINGPLQPANITWMHNGVSEPVLGFWNTVAAEFEAAHPGVTVTVQPVQNETLRNQTLPAALQGVLNANPPDLFQSWGGGELRDWANQGIAWDLTDVLAPTISTVAGNAAQNWQVDNHQYGLPYTYGPAGFWVNMDVLEKAGLVHDGTVDWPNSFDGLFSLWATLKEHDITPVALGGGDNWPAAWWWYATAVASCPASALAAAGNEHDFSDPCWVSTGSELQQIINQHAFNSDWQTTSAQGGATSAAGLVASGQAAMELTGPWGGRVIADSIGSGAIPSNIAWFPFPSDGNIMAGGDGFSVLNPSYGTQARSDAAAALLAYIMSAEVQTRFAEATQMAPTNTAATTTDPIVANQVSALSGASFAAPWLDVWFGSQIGGPMNQSISEFLAGQGAPQGIVDVINGAAGN